MNRKAVATLLLAFAGPLAPIEASLAQAPEPVAQPAALPEVQAPPPPKPNAVRGAIVYRSSCGICHREPKQFGKRFAGNDPKVRGMPLSAYLAGHHAKSEQPRNDLIAYLKTLQ